MSAEQGKVDHCTMADPNNTTLHGFQRTVCTSTAVTVRVICVRQFDDRA